MIKEALNVVDKVSNIADKTVMTDKVKEDILTRRLEIDNQSPYKIPHLIRPISTLFTGLIWGITVLWSMYIAHSMIELVGYEEAGKILLSSDSIIMYVLGATTSMYLTHVGFYFNSRRNEKIAAQKAKSEIKLKELETKAEMKKEEDRLALAEKIEKEQMRIDLKIKKRKEGIGFLRRKRRNDT